MRTFLLLIALLYTSVSSAHELPTPLVSTDWLAIHLDQVIIVDVRTDEKNFSSKPFYRTHEKSGKKFLARVGGHIPGARLIPYDAVRSEREIAGQKIGFMVPEKDSFQQLMQQAGVNQDSQIVVVTNAESGFDVTMAARVYWQLRYFGHDQVSILDGGTAQWLMDGRKIETSADQKHAKGHWQATTENDALFASSEEVQQAIEDDSIELIDVRSLSQYLGVTKSGKVSAAGHIPTAKVNPVDLSVTGGLPARFASTEELLQIAKAMHIDPQGKAITYCNSGHMAAGGWFVMHELLGNKSVALYDGSMHEWTAENRPVVVMKME